MIKGVYVTLIVDDPELAKPEGAFSSGLKVKFSTIMTLCYESYLRYLIINKVYGYYTISNVFFRRLEIFLWRRFALLIIYFQPKNGKSGN